MDSNQLRGSRRAQERAPHHEEARVYRHQQFDIDRSIKAKPTGIDGSVNRSRLANIGANAMDNSTSQSLVVTALWQVNPGEETDIAGLLKQFLPQAQQEPGVKEFQIHQNTSKPGEFFFYEVFAGEAAFADHQQTRHFKEIIVGQAIPKLAKRERAQFRFI
jgi:quinol monooxygenase YgiN